MLDRHPALQRLMCDHAPALLPAQLVRRGPISRAMRAERQRATLQRGLLWSAAVTLFWVLVWATPSADEAPVLGVVEALVGEPAELSGARPTP